MFSKKLSARSGKKIWLWLVSIPLLGLVAAAFSPRLHEPYVYSSRYITMRDGVKIAVDLYLPKNLPPGARIPAILQQTRYYRSNRLHVPLDWFWNDLPEKRVCTFTTHGYAWVLIDVRGSGASFGSRLQEWSPEEIRDGTEVVDWIISQPWSNQKVGAFGGSYEGTATEFLATNKHPAVKAIVPMSGIFDAYTDMAYPGGVHLNRFVHLWSDVTYAMDHDTFREKFIHGIGHFAYIGVRPVQGDHDESMLHAAMQEHKKNYELYPSIANLRFRDDGTQVRAMSPCTRAQEIRESGVAIYEVSGWYDGALPRAAIKRYINIHNPHSRMLLGPWDHQGQDLSPYPSHESHLERNQELVRFFDTYLKEPGTADDTKAVRYYTVAENKWKTADSWPPPANNTVLYLNANHSLTQSAPQESHGKDVYQVDTTAETGNRTRWNSLLMLDQAPGPYELRDTRDQRLLTYTGIPLTEDMEVTGHPTVQLFVDANAQNGNFFVYLEDLDEQGHAHYVTEGMLRAINRKVSEYPGPCSDPSLSHTYNRSDAMPLVPGQIAELSFDLQPISYLFRKGHSIRVAFAGADRSNFEFQPGDASIVAYYRETEHASSITLPVVSR